MRYLRSHQTWQPVAPVVDALAAAFYASFGNVRPSEKRWLLALDVSGSMGAGVVAGVPGLTPRVASATPNLIGSFASEMGAPGGEPVPAAA